MQNIFTLCLLVFFTLSSNAQFKKGDKVLGFGLNVYASSVENNSSAVPYTNNNTGLSLSIELGMAKKVNRLNGFFIGGGYGVNKNEYPTQPVSNNKSNSFNTGAGYFTKRYKSLGKNFFVFGEGRTGINYSQTNYTLNSVKSQGQQYGANLGLYPGLAYKWGNRFLFELRFADFVSTGYSQSESKAPNGIKDIQRHFSLGSSLGLGYLNNIGIGVRWVL